jgi:hypothetical protein
MVATSYRKEILESLSVYGAPANSGTNALAERVAEELGRLEEEVPVVHFLPWWVMLPALLACALAAGGSYLGERGKRRRWLLAILVVVLAPALLVARWRCPWCCPSSTKR